MRHTIRSGWMARAPTRVPTAVTRGTKIGRQTPLQSRRNTPFTINHADDSIILVNSEFVPILEQIWDRVDPGKKLLLLSDDGAAPQGTFTFVAEYEAMLAAFPAYFDFSSVGKLDKKVLRAKYFSS